MPSWADIVGQDDLENSRDGLNLALRESLRVHAADREKVVENASERSEGGPGTALKRNFAHVAEAKTRLEFKRAVLSGKNDGSQQDATAERSTGETRGHVNRDVAENGPRKRLACEMTRATSSDLTVKNGEEIYKVVEKESDSICKADKKTETRQDKIEKMIKSAERIRDWGDDDNDDEEEGFEDEKLSSIMEESSDNGTLTSEAGTASTSKYPYQPVEELTEERIAKRQKQIDLGKMTEGYKNYSKNVKRNERKGKDPRKFPSTPEKTERISKRSWLSKISRWRRALHLWDPQGIKSEPEKLEGAEN